jgi:hypothetical protein
MDSAIKHALETDGLIDITTIGKKSGEAHKIEIVFHYIDGAIYISGRPGRRDWYANLVANPDFTFHLKQSTKADLPARATPITAEPKRRAVMTKIVERWGVPDKLDIYLQSSPLVEVELK